MGVRALASQGRQERAERWNALSVRDTSLAVLGVAGKSATSAGVLVLLVGLRVSPVAGAVGAAIAALGLAAWWASARAVGPRLATCSTRSSQRTLDGRAPVRDGPAGLPVSHAAGCA